MRHSLLTSCKPLLTPFHYIKLHTARLRAPRAAFILCILVRKGQEALKHRMPPHPEHGCVLVMAR